MATSIQLSAHVWNPDFNLQFNGVGTFPGGEEEASTPAIQFNIKTESTGPKVVFVNKDNHGWCHIKVPDGYRIIGGESSVDLNNIYTRHENYDNPKMFPPAEIAQHVKIESRKVDILTWEFRVISTPSEVMGTINVKFTVRYQKAQ